jgi:hypothetical protein
MNLRPAFGFATIEEFFLALWHIAGDKGIEGAQASL